VAKTPGLTWTAVRRIGLALPGVEESSSYGTVALTVRGRFLTRLREDGESLAVKCGFDERDFRLQADPTTFFVTDHYRGYPTVLVHLRRVTPAVLCEVLEQAWRFNAPRTLIRRFDTAESPPPHPRPQKRRKSK
jgi:hypothetical protein